MRNQKVAVYLIMASMGVGLLLPSNSAYAKEVSENAKVISETSVQSLAGIKQDTELGISGATAEIKVHVKGSVSTKKISLTAKLQRKVDGKWKDVKTWEKHSNTLLLTFSETYPLSSKGSYRVQATVTYYQKDNTTETKTTNSATKTYS